MKFPKNSSTLLWTNHAIRKMAFYRLSESRIRRVLYHPKRTEDGIAPGTVALMQPEGSTKAAGNSVKALAMKGSIDKEASQKQKFASKKKVTEVWLMYQQVGKKKRIITCWRYPGTSPIRSAIPIPREILEELEKMDMEKEASGRVTE